ncbi:response regulator [Escherichia coli]|nr:response regulator [Escherichia coli]
MTSLKTSIKTITYLSDIGCLEIQGASLAGHNSRYKTLLNSSDFPSVVRRLHFTGSKLTIICSLMTTLKTCIRTITYLSDIGCLEIQGACLERYKDTFTPVMIK